MTRWLLLCNDLLRLDDNALLSLPTNSDAALVLCILPQQQFLPERASAQRLHLQLGLLLDFQQRLARLGVPLLLRHGNPRQILTELCTEYQINWIAAAEPTAPEEYQWATGLPMQWHDLNSLLGPGLRPDLATLPHSFTAFRQQREPLLSVSPAQQSAVAQIPLQRILSVSDAIACSNLPSAVALNPPAITATYQTHLPADFSDWRSVTEAAAHHRFSQYLQQHLSHYKLSRNQLIGADFASFLSIPLSRGTLSARQAWQLVQHYEQQYGQNESSYWLRFELLWREYFRHLQRKLPNVFFQHQGLGLHPVPPVTAKSAEALQRWQQGQTGLPFIDANMRLLAQTGWMSNRGRQNVASYLMFQLGCDWRLGAAWFERHLLDYDVASNWGNWAYIAGALYSAPRAFNTLKQALEYDPAATFTALLLGPPLHAAHRHQPYAQADWPAPQAAQWQQYLEQLSNQ